jgi:predicted Zn finger-like uncharacterized protein
MRIDCPSCAAAYDAPDSLVRPGIKVRCGRCGEEWVAVPAVLAPPAEQAEVAPIVFPAEDAPQQILPQPLSAMERLAQTPPARRSGGLALRFAWAASFTVLAMLVWGAYAWRSDVMRSWPPSIRLYDALGLTATAVR